MSIAPDPTQPLPPAPTRRGNGVGLAATIVGAVALVFAVIPVLSFVAWLPALAAIVLGIVGLVLKGRTRATSWIGLGLGVVSWIIAIIVTIASTTALVGAVSEAVKNATSAPLESAAAQPSDAATPDTGAQAAGGQLIYEVISDAATIPNISYMTATAGGAGQESATDAPAPFSKTIQVEQSGPLNMAVFSLVAQAASDATTISCRITYNGEVVAQQTSTGAFSVVTCAGNR